MTGDSVPESGLQMLISSDDLEKTVRIGSDSVTITLEDAVASGFVADANKLYQVTVTDYTGNTWYESVDGLSLGDGMSNSLALTNPVQTVDETLTLNIVCSADDLVSSLLDYALVTYSKDASSVTSVANESSTGVYALTQMDSSLSTYTVNIDTDQDGVADATTTVVPDGTDESFDIETVCIQIIEPEPVDQISPVEPEPVDQISPAEPEPVDQISPVVCEIGLIVRISPYSEFYTGGPSSSDPMNIDGTISSCDTYDNFPITVLWNNGTENFYRDYDLYHMD
jgi:hypothetical protein